MRDSVSDHKPREFLLNRWIRCGSKKTSKLRVAGLCVGNSPETDEFPAQKAVNTENDLDQVMKMLMTIVIIMMIIKLGQDHDYDHIRKFSLRLWNVAVQSYQNKRLNSE